MSSTYEAVYGSFEPPVVPDNFNYAADVIDDHANSHMATEPAIWVSSLQLETYTITYAQLAQRSHRAACMFWDAGVRPGNKVIMVMDKFFQWAEIALGLMRIGAVFSPGVSLLMPKEYAYRFNKINAQFFIGDNASYARLSKVADQCTSLQKCFLLDRAVVHDPKVLIVDYAKALNRIPENAKFQTHRGRHDDTTAIYFTSGTTGNPKAVAHGMSFAWLVGTAARYWSGTGPGMLSWTPADQGWIAYFYTVFGCLSCGGAFLVQTLPAGGVNPKFLLDVVHRLPITHMGGAASIYKLFTQEDNLKYLKAHPPKHLRVCTTGGEALPLTASQRWEAATGLPLHEGYGQTETAMLLCNFSQLKNGVRQGSMGRPVPGIVIACIDANGKEVPVNQEGEIAVRIDSRKDAGYGGRAIFKGYMQSDGSYDRRVRCEVGGEREWYVTGDRGRIDPDGYFWYLARSDDVISSSGYRIGPFEVEEALQTHPSVQICAVVGSPDRMRGQLVKAFVVLNSQYKRKDSTELVRELQEHVKSNAAPYKYPREIEFVATLPLTTTGKVKRAELRLLEEARKAHSKL